MKLFPTTNIDIYHEKGKHIKSKMMDFYDQYSAENQAFWIEAERDNRFYSGDQSIWNEIYTNTPRSLRNVFNFNRIRRIIDMISGHQRRSRKSIIVQPVESGDQQTADQYTKVFSHINRKEYVLETISDCFSDALRSGLSLLYVWNDYTDDSISGSLKVDTVSSQSVLMDPYFKKADLSDCNCIWKRTFLSKNQIKSLIPDKSKFIEEVAMNSDDQLFSFMPETTQRYRKNLLAYDEYYYLDSRPQTVVSDSQTGEQMEWNGTQETLNMYLSNFPTVISYEVEKPTVRLAILVNGSLVHDGLNPLGVDNFPFIPMFGYFNPNLSDYSLKLQSAVRGLRDPQYLYNMRKNLELKFQQSTINSGYIYKEQALVNPDDIFLVGEGKGLALKAEAQMTDVQSIIPPQIPPSMFQLSEILAREIQEISGVNEELLGSADDDKAGVLSMLRQGAGLTTLQTLFDQLDRSQKILGNIMLGAIQANYTPGKVKRIIEEEPAPQFYNKAFGIYDAAVVDGFNTSTQKQMEFESLMRLKEAGLAIPDDVIIEAATLQNKNKLIEKMAQINQAQQQQAQQAEQVQQQLIQSQAALAQAKVQSDLSLAKERDSRVYSNVALMDERRQEAEKDKTQSMLNLVKTLQEIDTIDIDQLTKLIQVSNMVKIDASQGNNSEQLGSAIVTGATKDANITGANPQMGQPQIGQP